MYINSSVGGADMAEICYIINTKIERKHTEQKSTEVMFALYEMYDKLDIEELEKEIKEKRGGKCISIDVSVLDAVLAVKRVRLNKKELLKIIVYEDKEIQNIRDVFYADILSIKEAVTEIVKMGIGLIRSDIKDIVNIIEKAYRRLEIVVDTDEVGIAFWIKEIAAMCMHEIESYTKKEKQTEESANGIKIQIEADRAYIAVRDFAKWYDETEYRDKLSVSTVREEFKNAGITICNSGRTDYNKTKTGKVIAFDIEKLKAYCKKEDKVE